MPHIIVGSLFIAIVVTAGWLIIFSNTIINKQAEADYAWEQIVQQLLMKADLLSMLAEKSSVNINQEMPLKVIIMEVKVRLSSASSIKTVMLSASQLNELYRNIIKNSQQFTELLTCEEYIQLDKKLEEVEMKLLASLQQYNQFVAQQKNVIESFPNNVAIKILGYKVLTSIQTEDIVNQIR